MTPIKVLFVAGELTPLAKVGGLGDVIGALPKSLVKKGVDARIVIPKYGIVEEKKYGLKKIAADISVPFAGQEEKISIYESLLPGSQVPVYYIDNLKYLGGGGVYFEKDASSGGSSRECQRFTFFARAIPEIFEKLEFWPDIVHCHDWHVGLVPFLLKEMGKKDGRFGKIKTLLTIHNFAYQGKYNYDEATGYLNLKKDGDLEEILTHFDAQTINYLQQAIAYADLINTVSPTYAREILTPSYGEGLNKFLAKRKKDLSGIVNGIDAEIFNPETDPNLACNYSLNDLQGKSDDKIDLQKITGLTINEKIPIFGLVGRLADQKGVDLLAPLLSDLTKKGCQFIILGAGLTKFEEIVRKMASDYPDNVFAKIAFDAALAQKIYAGADFFLMPSRFEPCGLGQMIAMRYGTIPIVRATGGLSDTVEEFTPETGQGTGFRFNNFKADEFLASVEKSLEIFQNKESWRKIKENAMRQDFSWERSGGQYLKLYQKLKI
ncbi:MAG: glycogen/starch synthase [Patescibacteria group bacterium]